MRSVIINKSNATEMLRALAVGRKRGLADCSEVIDQLMEQLQATRAQLQDAYASLEEARAVLLEARAEHTQLLSKLEMLNEFYGCTRTETGKMH